MLQKISPILINAARLLVRLGVLGEVAVGEFVDRRFGGQVVPDTRRVFAIRNGTAEFDGLRPRLIEGDLTMTPEPQPTLCARKSVFQDVEACTPRRNFTPKPGIWASHR